MLSILIIIIIIIEAYAIDTDLRLSKLMLSIFTIVEAYALVSLFLFELGADATGFFFILENLNITIKTSTLDCNGERYLSSIINCVIFRL
jgi:hypothetical protein